MTATDVTGVGAAQEATWGYYRSAVDKLHTLVWMAVAAVLLVVTVVIEDSILGFEQDVIVLFDFLSPSIERFLHGSVELASALIALGLFIVPLLGRRLRLFGYLVAAWIGALAAMSAIDALVSRTTSTVLVNQLAERAGIEQAATSGVVGLAQLTALIAVYGPFAGRRWRRAGAIAIVAVTLLRLLVSARLPVDLLVALPVGAAVGAGVLVVFGRPDRSPTLRAVIDGLADTGLATSAVTSKSVGGRAAYTATIVDADGRDNVLDVKVVGADERAADVLTRGSRFVRLKNVGDARPFSSLRRRVEHEALVTLMVRDVGVRSPRVRAVVDLGGNNMLIAHDAVDDAEPASDSGDAWSDELLLRIWEQVAILHRHRIAHRALRLSNIAVDRKGEVWLTGVEDAEIAAPPALLDADVAELLTSQALAVGPTRAVEAAISGLGTDAVGGCLPRLQPRAMSTPTQSDLEGHPDLLGKVQQLVMDRCGVDDVEFAELERISRQTIVTLVALVAAVYFLLPQFADLPGIVDQVRNANWAWTPLMLLTTAFTFVAAAISLAGAAPGHLAAGPLVASRVGTGFAGKLGPGGVGGMALSVRFLQKQGTDRAIAVSSVGLDTIGGIIGHLSLVVVFVVWAGSDAFGSIDLPDPTAFLIGLAVVVALFVLGMLIPTVRQVVVDKTLPTLRRSLDGVGTVIRRPAKVTMLYGGSVLITLSALITLFFALEAFGGGLPLATVGAVFLVGAAVAQIAPTPGGVGAMEAALIGGLVGAGLDNALAVPAVFLFRLVTFWLPLIPGWFAFTWLQRNDYL